MSILKKTTTAPKCKAIIGQVADMAGFSAEVLCGRSRMQDIADARHFAMYAIRELTGTSFPLIGRYLGGRHHTTVMYACSRVASMPITTELMAKLDSRLNDAESLRRSAQ